MKQYKNAGSVLFLLLILFLSSCVSNKRIKIFSELKNETSSDIVPGKIDNTIKASDILQITVFSQDEEIKRITNNISMTAAPTAQAGYLVDDSGFIKFPLLGMVKCQGLTREQLEDSMVSLLVIRKIALDPIVSVRISNFKITVLGEVNRPGLITVQNERVSIVEAIGMAGDLTIFAERDNILLIREQNGKRLYKRFSLNDAELFSKDYYYLQNQDVLYIEPTKAKAASLDRSTQFISIGLSAMSILLLVYTQLINN